MMGNRVRFKMVPNHETVFLVLAHCTANITIGVSLLLWSNLAAESVLNHWFPYWFWPAMFISAGVCAFFGLFSRLTAQFSFAFAAIITALFGLASLYSVVVRGNLSAVATTVFLLYIAILKVYLSWEVSRRDDIVQQVADATEKAQTALDRATDGTTTT